MIAMPMGDSVSERVREFDYAAERLITMYDRILAAEPIAVQFGDDMATAWGLAYAVTHHARTVLNASTTKDWDLDFMDEDDCLGKTKGRNAFYVAALAPPSGLEPETLRLTVECSAN